MLWQATWRRVAGRILGQGDVVALVEKASADLDQAKAEAMAKKLAKGWRPDNSVGDKPV